MEEIHVKSPDDLGDVLDVVHDCWFDFDAIEYDDSLHSLVIPFDRKIEKANSKKFLFWHPMVLSRHVLIFDHVIDYEICDTEQIGLYDFNEIIYSTDTGVIMITSGIPLDFRIHVSELSLRVRQQD